MPDLVVRGGQVVTPCTVGGAEFDAKRAALSELAG